MKKSKSKNDILKEAVGNFHGLPELRLGNKDSPVLREGFKQLLGYPASSELDRKLLAGLFEKD